MFLSNKNGRSVGAIAVAVLIGTALSGCISATADSPHNIAYSANVSGGTIAVVTYSTAVKGDAGTKSLTLSSAKWSLRVDHVSDPILTVKPTGQGIAHCVVTTTDGEILAEKTGKAGEAAVCSPPV